MFQSAILSPAYHEDLRVFFMPCISFSNPRDPRDTWRRLYKVVLIKHIVIALINGQILLFTLSFLQFRGTLKKILTEIE